MPFQAFVSVLLTGLPYPDLYFDVCLVGVTDSELVFAIGFVDFNVETNRRKFVSAEGTPQWLEPDVPCRQSVSGGLPQYHGATR